MNSDTKDIWDIGLRIIELLGAAIAFWFGLMQWRRGQDWQRAERMDKFVEQFEKDDLLQLAATIIDWTRREIKFRDKGFVVTNTDSLLALRNHLEMRPKPDFPGNQPTLRDAYDALLAFFVRLELAISTKLIDAAPAKKYFGYWLRHFLAFDKHPDEKKILNGKLPREMVTNYIKLYGDPESIRRLCEFFEMDVRG